MWRSAGRKRSACSPTKASPESCSAPRMSRSVASLTAVRIVAQREVRDLQPLKAVPGYHLAGLPNIRSSEEPIADCILHAGPPLLAGASGLEPSRGAFGARLRGTPVCIAPNRRCRPPSAPLSAIADTPDAARVSSGKAANGTQGQRPVPHPCSTRLVTGHTAWRGGTGGRGPNTALRRTARWTTAGWTPRTATEQ